MPVERSCALSASPPPPPLPPLACLPDDHSRRLEFPVCALRHNVYARIMLHIHFRPVQPVIIASPCCESSAPRLRSFRHFPDTSLRAQTILQVAWGLTCTHGEFGLCHTCLIRLALSRNDGTTLLICAARSRGSPHASTASHRPGFPCGASLPPAARAFGSDTSQPHLIPLTTMASRDLQ
jgi:hypothetical protein